MRSLAFFSVIVAIFNFSLISAHAAEMSVEQQVSAKSEIKMLVDGYAIHRDSLNADAYADLFAEDGKFIFRGTVYTGREVLQQRIKDVNPLSTTMHVMASSLITLVDEEHATGVHYAMIYSKMLDKPVERGETIPVKSFAVMGKYLDKYTLTKAGWKIAERSFQPVFSPEK
jgi:hypothetical protein